MRTIEIKTAYDFTDLCNACWAEAVDTLQAVSNANKEDELMELIYNSFGYIDNELPTITDVNDLLRFDAEWIFNMLDIRTQFCIDELDATAYNEAIDELLWEMSPHSKEVDEIRQELPDASDDRKQELLHELEIIANSELIMFDANGRILAD